MRTDDGTRIRRRLAPSLGVSILAVVVVTPVASAAPKTKLVSQSSAGAQANETSEHTGDISGTGRFVTFSTEADNLVPGDDNTHEDVFIRDLKKGKTKLISVATGGGVGDFDSKEPSISANARWVAFASRASDIISTDTGGEWHIYVRDRKTGTTELVSKSSAGVLGNDQSQDAAISADGRWVAFESDADNLVVTDTKGWTQVYLYDRRNDKIMLVSRNKAGAAGDATSEDGVVSADGRFVAYESEATNLTEVNTHGVDQVYLFHKNKKKTWLMSRSNKGKAGNLKSNNPALNGNASKVVFNSLATNLRPDSNGTADAYMRNRKSGKTQRISLNWKGKQLNKGSFAQDNSDPDISANGRYVAFESNATNAVMGLSHSGDYDHIYVRNLVSGKVKLVSRRAKLANRESDEPELTAKGTFISFASEATNLIKGGDDNGTDEDIFRRGPLN